MMKGVAGVRGVAGTGRLRLGIGRINSGHVFHHSQSRAVSPIANSKTNLSKGHAILRSA